MALIGCPHAGFNPTQASTLRGSEPLRRARSIARSPLDGRKDKDKRTEAELRGSEVRCIGLRYTILYLNLSWLDRRWTMFSIKLDPRYTTKSNLLLISCRLTMRLSPTQIT